MGLESFTYDGINSLDYGMYVTQRTVWDAPKRVVSMIQVAGRNGDLTIDEGKYENVRVRYTLKCNATTKDEFAEKVKLFRNALCSRTGYKRLTDTYNQGEYRMGVFITEFSVTGQFNNTAGVFDVEFNCKPQRFLTAGETERSIPEWSDVHSDSGSIVTIDNSSGEYAVKSLSMDIEPQQDLNGYDNPWAGGAGKNKLVHVYPSETKNGVTFTENANGTVSTSGTATANAEHSLTWRFAGQYGTCFLKAGTYILSGCPSGGGSTKYEIGINTTVNGSGVTLARDYGSGATFTMQNDGYVGTWITIRNGQNASGLTFKPMIEQGSTATAYEPYENICPITGFDSASVNHVGKNWIADFTETSSCEKVSDHKYKVTKTGTTIATRSGSANSLMKGGTQYTISYNADLTNISINVATRVQYTDNTYSSNLHTSTSGDNTFTFTPAKNVKLLQFYLGGGDSTGIGQYAIITNLMARLSSDTDATFKPYNGNTYSVSFGSAGTVYGGTLDAVSGQLIIDKVSETLTSESQLGSVTTSASYGPNDKFYCQYETKRVNNQALVMCDRALSISFDDRVNYVTNDRVYADTDTGSNLILRCSKDSTITTKTDFFNYWQGAQIVYTLATPLTYQLTPTQVAFLLGTNNVWSDTGDIQIEYGKGGYTLYNPTPFDSLPLIKVTGTGTLGIGDWILTITGLSSQTLYIDCDMMEVYKNTGGIIEGANSLVSINKNTFPELVSGVNNITKTSGLTNLKITPRWWRI